MILKNEISKIAEQKKVAKSTIDKDWVLGHFVDAIFSIPECRSNLVFKGGTCLRKCWFRDYRFSEDLDFTSLNSNFVFDHKLLKKVVALVKERTGLPVHIQKLEELRFKEQLTGYSGIIKFWGADHPRNQAPPPVNRWQTSIKIEIILYEEMVFEPVVRKIHHEYSDQLSETSISGVPCYSIQEVLAEKIRALIQRSYTAPRDLYDIWYLSRNVESLDWNDINSGFRQKMKFKGLDFFGVSQMLNEENDKRLSGAWKSSLGHQVPGDNFPEYGVVRTEVERILTKYMGNPQ